MTSEMKALIGNSDDGSQGKSPLPLHLSNNGPGQSPMPVQFAPPLLFQALVNSIPQLVWRARPNGAIDYLSDQWYDFTGMKRFDRHSHERLDNDWRSVIHLDDAQAFLAAWKQSVDSGERFEADCRINRAGHGYRWHLCRATPVRDASGTIVGWYGTSTYMDEQRKERDGMIVASAAKDRFLAVLSHELRTPLNPALLILAELLSDGSLPAHIHERLQAVHRNIEHEASLVGDLVDISAGLHGKLALRCVAMDMRDVVMEALEVCQGELNAKNIGVTIAWNAPPGMIIGDPNRLRQVMRNLLRNAAKFTPEGGKVEIGAACTSQLLLRIWVKDNGIGINPDALPRLFAPFEQAEATTNIRFGGLGLGLAIARNIAELHLGSLFAVSDGEGQGATFVLEIPLLPSAIVPAPRETRVSPSEVPPVQPLAILLVEDHLDSAIALGRLLRSFGHTTECVHSASAALEKARSKSFDLVVSDILLPDLVGWEFIRILRQFSKAPAIAISGLGSDDDVNRCLKAGFNDYLVKPVSIAALRASISAVALPARKGPCGSPLQGATCAR